MVASKDREPAPKHETTVALEDDRAIVIARTFNGPARIVFEAWTRPEIVRRWWAPKSRGVVVIGCDADVRVGGRYRYVLRTSGDSNCGPAGEIAFSGRYTEVTPHTRLVYTQVFESMQEAGEVIITVTFEEQDGKTRLVSHELYPSAEVREAVLASGMEDGLHETYDQLDALVASLA